MLSYYEILNVSESSSQQEIKAAYHKSALINHPDKNNNSQESHVKFIQISNAYSILADSAKKKEYDLYLHNSMSIHNQNKYAVKKKSQVMISTSESFRSINEILSFLNFLLWDVEDFISRKGRLNLLSGENRKTAEEYVMTMLTFIDKWVITPAGYPDYFMQARKLKDLDPRKYIKDVISKSDANHHPFSNLSAYFYDLRKRTDKFIDNVKFSRLFDNVPGYNMRLIDCIIESQNLSVHYLSYLLCITEDGVLDVPKFIYSDSVFK